ncbi:MAG: fused MFS/spermidine synthase [Actinobacteria bacterium]|nr:fused MFS/spermidine synthase [Actinomycetota bacterium]
MTNTSATGTRAQEDLRQRPDRRSLYGLVFLAGIGSMATEMCASRLLAPFYGSSTVVWANIIGLILVGLSVGYILGGRLADRHPTPRTLGLVVIAAAALIAIIPFVAQPLLRVTVRGLEQVSAGAVIGSFFGSALLFVPPVVLLGMVSPMAVRLGTTSVDQGGRTVGGLYALSTIGSLLGTFLPVLFFIPLIGTQRTLLGTAALIAASGALLLGARYLGPTLVLAGLMAVPPGVVKPTEGLLYEKESLYQFVQVAAAGNARYLYLNEGFAVHSIWRRDHVLTGGEWDMFLTTPALLDRPAARVAILGNAGGTTARAMAVFYPDTTIDGVEIDPEVSRAGEALLGLADNPRLNVITADARPFLMTTPTARTAVEGPYDIIMIDAYRQPYVPFYLATREFFQLVRDRLAPDGIIAMNVSTVPGDDRLARAIAGTLAAEFPQVLTWQALRYNQLVLGFKTPVAQDELRRRLAAAPPDLLPLTELLAATAQPAAASVAPWTDDLCPVEWITDQMIVLYAAGGTVSGEQLLPTAP